MLFPLRVALEATGLFDLQTDYYTLAIMKRLVGILIASLISSPALGQVQRVTIYFIPWDVMTRVDLSAADVRRSPWVRTQILDAGLANRFLHSLDQQPLEDVPNRPVRNIRLVIDVESQSDTPKTFVANRFNLLDESSGSVRRVDAEFRSRFVLVP